MDNQPPVIPQTTAMAGQNGAVHHAGSTFQNQRTNQAQQQVGANQFLGPYYQLHNQNVQGIAHASLGIPVVPPMPYYGNQPNAGPHQTATQVPHSNWNLGFYPNGGQGLYQNSGLGFPCAIGYGYPVNAGQPIGNQFVHGYLSPPILPMPYYGQQMQFPGQQLMQFPGQQLMQPNYQQNLRAIQPIRQMQQLPQQSSNPGYPVSNPNNVQNVSLASPQQQCAPQFSQHVHPANQIPLQTEAQETGGHQNQSLQFPFKSCESQQKPESTVNATPKDTTGTLESNLKELNYQRNVQPIQQLLQTNPGCPASNPNNVQDFSLASPQQHCAPLASQHVNPANQNSSQTEVQETSGHQIQSQQFPLKSCESQQKPESTVNESGKNTTGTLECAPHSEAADNVNKETGKEDMFGQTSGDLASSSMDDPYVPSVSDFETIDVELLRSLTKPISQSQFKTKQHPANRVGIQPQICMGDQQEVNDGQDTVTSDNGLLQALETNWPSESLQQQQEVTRSPIGELNAENGSVSSVPEQNQATRQEHEVLVNSFNHVRPIVQLQLNSPPKVASVSNQALPIENGSSDMIRQAIPRNVVWFVCPKCGYRMRNKTHMEYHMSAHKAKNVYPCDKCRFISAHKESLARHKKTHDKSDATNQILAFACHICQFRMLSKQHLEAHIKAHRAEVKFSCGKCLFISELKHSLTRHLKTHDEGATKYSCHLCVYQTVHKYQLDGHIRNHSEEKEFSCNLCKYQCMEKRKMFQHVLTHDRVTLELAESSYTRRTPLKISTKSKRQKSKE